MAAVSLETIIALAKRRGFFFPSSELYGGLNGIYDAGPLGVLLKNNIRAAWTRAHDALEYDIVPLEGALLGPETLWKASGHVENFHDPMVDCLACKHRYRADDINLDGACPHCGNKKWTDVRVFHMMFSTQLGAAQGASSVAYLRPETAQAIYVNVKNVMTTMRLKVPFGISQIGKAFRNEITPKQFLFRMREFEQMELEWVCTEQDAPKFFDYWREHRKNFYAQIGIKTGNIRLRDHDASELAHYSRGTTDIEYQFPFGWKELEGIAYRGNFDLTQHAQHAGKDLSVFDETTKSSYVPHIVECSVGVDRLSLALLCDAYDEDTADGEKRVVLRLHKDIAPIRAAIFPLSKEHSSATEKIYHDLKRRGVLVEHDHSGSIGKRYRRQDEIGTPYCITYDFDSAAAHTVTVRERDSMKQERIAIDDLYSYLMKDHA